LTFEGRGTSDGGRDQEAVLGAGGVVECTLSVLRIGENLKVHSAQNFKNLRTIAKVTGKTASSCS
jgi:hypothetical protein